MTTNDKTQADGNVRNVSKANWNCGNCGNDTFHISPNESGGADLICSSCKFCEYGQIIENESHPLVVF